MTGKIIDSGAPVALVLIVPIALVLVVLFTAWPFLLLLIALGILWKIWDNYQWQKLSKQVNPCFYQLIKDNQGCLTPIDLSLKANLNGRVAKQFLERKSEEYGGQRQEIEDKGTVYYFLTAGALGTIFEDSEPLTEQESEELASPTTHQLATSTSKVVQELHQSSASEIAQTNSLENQVKGEESLISSQGDLPKEEGEESLTLPEDSLGQVQVADKQEKTYLSLIQAELAKRLDVNSSTVGRRKSDPDFPEWTKSKDPEAIAWKYMPDTKVFVSIDFQK
ncbi:MAG: hypothetical protein AB4038_18165 [Prochloraceae cyanobacterium]